MNLNYLELQNFISYKKLRFDFSKNGLYLITGETGSGKSAIFEGILWCLFGRTVKKVKMEELINENEEKNCFVKLSFEKKNVTYKVVRYRSHDEYGDELKLYIDKKEYQGKDTQNKIESIIGLTDKLFIISNLITNDESSNILNIQRAKRIDIFEEIFGLSGLDAYEKKVLEGIKNTNNQIAANLNKLIELKTKQEVTQSSIDDYLKNKKVRITEIKNEIKELEEERDSIDKKDKEKILATYKLITQKEEEKEKLEEKLGEHVNEMTNISNNIQRFIEEESTIMYDSKRLKVTSRCNVCDSELSGDKYKKLSKTLGDKLIELRKNLEKENLILKKIEDNTKKLEKEDKTVSTELEKLVKIFNNMAGKNALDIVDTRYGLDKTWLKNLEDRFDTDRYNKNIKALQDELEELTNDTFVKDAKKRLAQIEKEIPEYTTKEQKLKEDLEYWTFWKKAFDVKADNNIKKFRIQKIITKFNEIIAIYINKFFPDENVKLMFRDNLDESIRFEKRQRSYKMLSKGQKKIIDNCINFAFFEMARLMTKSQFPAIFVDEITDGLDNKKSNSIVDILSTIARDDVVYVISHDKTIKDSVDGLYEVWVDKDEETSKIKTIF